MRPDFYELDSHLDTVGADGYLIDAASDDADQRYLSGYDAADPFISLYADGSIYLLFWGTDYYTAREESHADRVYHPADYGYDGYGSLEEQRRVLGRFVRDHDVRSVAVPERFPLGSATGLRNASIEVIRDTDGFIANLRSRKSDDEIDAVRDSIRAAEAGFQQVETLLAEAIVADGWLEHGGERLTADRLRRELRWTMLNDGFDLPVSVVAAGTDTAEPHGQSHGPIAVDEPVLVDLGPVDQETGYYADLTRTFVRGEPPQQLAEWYDLVRDALAEAVNAIGPGVTGHEVNDLMCSYFEDRGISTLRSDPGIESGVLHYMGHGIGLDVHEDPLCAPDGGELEPGNVLAVEPAVYEPGLGGVRLEDDIIVTETGCRHLTTYPKELVVDPRD